jgi:serine/threonine-protein kinase
MTTPSPQPQPFGDETKIMPGAADGGDVTRVITPAPPKAPTVPPAAVGGADDPTLIGAPSPLTPADVPGAIREVTTLPHGRASAPGGGDSQMRQVGRYLVQSRLGRGGMATVYKAHDPSIGRDVAIKFLHASLSEDEECRMRFLREARAAGGLSHPNIVVVHDVGEIERRPYMAMELIDGPPLSDVLESKKTLPIRDVVVMGLQLARALEYAHARGIVHRDIKPGNIMLLRDGQTVKVADFGIAHMDDGTGDQRTLVGAVMGTPQYMSPEQTRGDKVDGRSDLFSAGIVLYQMLSGERPFRGDSIVAVASRIANEDPPPLNQKRPDVPASLRRVVDRCLAKQPAQRYQTGKELADALLKVLAEIDEAASERDKPRIVPLRVKWAATMALIVAVVMGITTTVVTQRQYAAMMAQVKDYGASLARFIAAQNAAAVLGEEWEAVDVAVQEIMKSRNFERVSVVDNAGVVRVSSQPALVGQRFQALGTEVLGSVDGGTAVVRYQAGGEDVLGFEAPVLFQGKQLGSVRLGIPEAPLTQVARLSISLMVALAVITVLAVAIAMYFVANWFAKPIRLVGESMAEIGKGRFDHRIGEQRNDEFGLLFRSFDDMAQALQRREPGTPASPPTLLPGAAATQATSSSSAGQAGARS